MSKHSKSSKFTYIPTQELPKLPKKVPTSWDMEGLYYKSIDDPQIEKDVRFIEKLERDFVKAFKDSDFCTNPRTLKEALDYINASSLNPRTARPMRYLGLLSTLNTQDTVVQKRINVFDQRITKATNQSLFFGLQLANVPQEKQKQFLTDPKLIDHTYQLRCIFESAKYNLSESEEKILRLLGDTSYGMWTNMTEKMLGKRSIEYKGETIPVNSAFERITTLPFKEQPAFWSTLMQEVGTLEEVVENELTAICTRKKIGDELRGYKKPYSAAILSKEDDEKSVEALIDAVSTKGFALSKKFYRLKAKLHGGNTIHYAQRNASLRESPTIDFVQATEICRDTFYSVNSEYGEIFDRMLLNGQIDVYPKQGKRGGAFMSAETAQPTQVFLNHVDTMRSVETLAHEMGHAIHSERSKSQPPHYNEYSLTTAETASTLFENILFDNILAQATDEQKATLLHDKINGDIATIQRQIAFHNFELEMHLTVREQGSVTRAELNTMMQKHLKAYCGPAVEIGALEGNSYIYVSHFRYGFYVYSYAFGILMSAIMAENLAQEPTYTKNIDMFLSAGGSDNVANIFKNIGLNTKEIQTFEQGLNKMESEIKLLQKLTK